MTAPHGLVTVQAGQRRVDLTLPITVPIIELTPEIARLCGTDPADHPAPAWTLARVGSAPMELSASLADAGITDGDILHLVEASSWRAPVVIDVAETISEAVDSAAPQWTVGHQSAALAGLGAVYMIAAATLTALGGGGAPRTALAACAAIALIALPLFIRTLASSRAVHYASAVGGLAFAGVAGWSSTGGAAGTPGVTGAAVGVALGALGAAGTLPVVAPALIVVATAIAGSAAAVEAGARPVQDAAVVAVLGVLALRLLPRMVGRRLNRQLAGKDPDQLEAAARRSLRQLSSLCAGCAACLLGAVIVLAADGGWFAEALAAATGIALVFRARSFRFLPEVLPLAVVAAGTLLALVVAVGTYVANPVMSIAVLFVIGAAFGTYALRHPGHRAPASGQHVLVSRIVDTALVPLALGAMGLFGLLIHIAHGIGK